LQFADSEAFALGVRIEAFYLKEVACIFVDFYHVGHPHPAVPEHDTIPRIEKLCAKVQN
jgi:hypothetical protein